MERFGVVGLLVVCLPVLARAQRVEVALLAGAYHPFPTVSSGSRGLDCNDSPCPTHFHEKRDAGRMIGGRMSMELSSRFGIDATVQSVASISTMTFTEGLTGPFVSETTREVVSTFIALQPHFRSRLGEPFELTVSAGPALTAGLPRSGNMFAIAFSGTLRTILTRAVALELGASDFHIVGEQLGDNRNHVTVYAGLAVAVRQ